MKVVIKSNLSDPGVTQDLLFQDKAINKVRIKKGSRKILIFLKISSGINIHNAETRGLTLKVLSLESCCFSL